MTPPYDFPQRGMVSSAEQTMVERPDVPRSRFTGRQQIVTTFDAGYLVPFVCYETLPGDHFALTTHAYVRMSTPLFPLYSEQRVDVHWFYCPNRLLWTNWQRFMGAQDNPSSSITYTIPQISSTGNGFVVGGVGDYLGLPTVGQPTAPLTVSALPFRMYNLVYNQWYRDENLINSATQVNTDGPDAEGSYALRVRAKLHDYFTSCLPWAQKFTPPPALGTQAPVTGLAVPNPTPPVGGAVAIWETPNSTNPTGAGNYANSWDATAPFYMQATAGGVPQVFADLSAISVNVLRQSFMIQSLLERDARGGTRYVELIDSHFGTRVPDYRLQRTEYVGGQTVPLGTTPIAQTTPVAGGGTLGVGNLGGTTAAFGNGGVSYASLEHGYLMGIMSVRSELLYSQGIERHWTRQTRYEYYWPSLALLGEQPVYRREIFATGVPANDLTVFGYMPAWDDMRYTVSRATGLFRPTAAGNIDEWHTGQQFNPAPTLGQTFIQDTPPMTRVLAAGSAANGMQYLANIVIEIDRVRPMPTHATPATIGRF